MINLKIILTLMALSVLLPSVHAQGGVCADITPEDYPSAFTKPKLIYADKIWAKYLERYRNWQGIPAIEITDGGRLWASWYAGPVQEGKRGNFIVLATSDDDGATWSPPVVVFDSSTFFNATSWDPSLWKDAQGNLFFSVTRSMELNKEKVGLTSWFFKAQNPEDPFTSWGEATLKAKGVALNKPTFLKNGNILQPVDVRHGKDGFTNLEWNISKDGGKTFEEYSKVPFSESAHKGFGNHDAKRKNFMCEHQLVERKDGTLWMLTRTVYGLAEASSKDGGKTWIDFKPYREKFCVNTRFYLGKLKSGNLILVANDHEKSRSNMTVFLSEDDGETWGYKLVLDERGAVSYPDATQSKEGYIYIAYDRGRYAPNEQEILFAKITEADIKAGKLVDPKSKLKQIINTLTGMGGGAKDNFECTPIEANYKDAIEKLKKKK